MNDAYYFGCWGDSGHFMFNRDGETAERNARAILPPPLRVPDATLTPKGPQIQGVALLHHVEGWTAISFWDRSVDSRPGSNSTFILRGTLTWDEVIEQSRAAFPSVWARFKFEVRRG